MRLLLLCLTFLCPLASAGPTDCVGAIETAIALFNFNSTEEQYHRICRNDLSLFSMWAAAKIYCKSAEEISAGSVVIEGYCVDYGLTDLVPYETYLPRLTDSAIAALPVVGFSDISPLKVWNHSVLISNDLYHSAFRTITVFNESYVLHRRYGWGVYGFWGGILLVGSINRLVHYFCSIRNGRASPDKQGAIEAQSSLRSPSTVSSNIFHWVQTNFIIPPVFGSHHRRRLFSFTVPTRAESLVILAYYAYSIIVCAISYEVFYPNLYYTKGPQAWRYIADRTGIVSYANLPVMWIFSGRNNVFLWATGWDFSTFNVFHRHIARIATVQAIVHSVAYTVVGLDGGDYYLDWEEQYWYMGALATITMSLMLPFSSSFLRQKSYEIFLVIHIVLSLVTLISLFFHTKIFEDYNDYLWPVVAIWVFDRLLRLIRQAYLNLSLSSFATTQTKTEFLEPANLLILTVTLPAKRLDIKKSNTHFFLYQPFQWRGWENHPFTAVVTGSRNLTFYIRPYGKFTGRLMKSQNPSLIVEGPYSDSGVDLGRFDHVLLIAGGSGASATLSYLHCLIACERMTQGKRVKFVWAAREEAMVREIVKRELSSLSSHANVEIEIFVTSPESQVWAQLNEKVLEGAEDGFGGKGESKNKKLEVPRVKYHYGQRPNLGQAIDEISREGQQAAVVVCGPPEMADEGRAAVRQSLKKGRRLEFVDIGFAW